MAIWEFFRFGVLPWIILGLVLVSILILLWFIGKKVPRFEYLKDISPDKFYQFTIVVIIIIVFIYMIFSGEGAGIDNEGFQ